MDGAGAEWPEPVVRVQSLSESGAATIPDRYVKPEAERPAMSAAAPEAELTEGEGIPVVDMSSPGDPATARAVSEACREWGFFQAVNHGVPPELLRRARGVWRGFFRQPMEVKQMYANSPATYEGETTEEYSREVAALCGRLMTAMSVGLGAAPARLQEAFGGEEGAGVCVRVNYYPRCPQPELTLGLSSHSDPGGMTVLLADDRVKGLQVRRRGAWVTVDPVPDAFIVNVGDQIQVLTNATYRSVEHRVMVNAAEERLSVALFYNPRSDLPLAPMPELVSPDRPSLYKPMTFDEYRLYIRREGPRGKSQVESLKATAVGGAT
ncbi:hypothetical protein HU200_009278 [Digitaria exilis]|uniref:Fe2OG dioxygenase domain-containing protein n=1 Tax=Digitaria exilis TaxID=1010633 RepID=A0A835FK16_9POAL|nr:hypothetical protein HU200_009278 [Digitaria exilis]